jgi:hypothetical protein
MGYRKGGLAMIYGDALVYEKKIPGVVCCSSASGIQGLCGADDTVVSMYAPVPKRITSRNYAFFPNQQDAETIQHFGYTVTSPFQTIMDMIKFECDIEFTTDSLKWWKRKYGSLDVIFDALKERGLYESYLENYAEWMEE